jgi:hypothetical protein
MERNRQGRGLRVKIVGDVSVKILACKRSYETEYITLLRLELGKAVPLRPTDPSHNLTIPPAPQISTRRYCMPLSSKNL